MCIWMNELRQRVLNDLGISVWVERSRLSSLPGSAAVTSGTATGDESQAKGTAVSAAARASALRAVIEPLAEVEPASSARARAAGEQGSGSAGVSAQAGSSESIAASQTAGLRVIACYWSKGAVLIAPVASSNQPVTHQGRLIKDLLCAAVRDWQVKVQQVIFDPADLGDPTAGHRAQAAFIRKRVQVAAAQCVFVVAPLTEQLLEVVQEALAPGAQVVACPELDDLLQDHEAKRQLWQSMSQRTS